MEAVRSLLDAFEVNDAKKMKSSLQSLNVQVENGNNMSSCKDGPLVESLLAIANDRDMDTNSVYNALTVLLCLWENKETRSWIVDAVLSNQTLQSEIQQLARGITDKGSYQCQMAATDIVYLHYNALQKRRNLTDELTCLADALPSPLTAVFKTKAPQGEDISAALRESNNFPSAKVRFVPITSVTINHDQGEKAPEPVSLDLDEQSSLMIVDNKCVQFAVVADDGEEITDLLVQFKNVLAVKDKPSIIMCQEKKTTVVTFATHFAHIENVNEIKLPKAWLEVAKGSNAQCTFSIRLDSTARPAEIESWLAQALSSFEEWSRVAETPVKATNSNKTSVASLGSISTLHRVAARLEVNEHSVKADYSSDVSEESDFDDNTTDNRKITSSLFHKVRAAAATVASVTTPEQRERIEANKAAALARLAASKTAHYPKPEVTKSTSTSQSSGNSSDSNSDVDDDDDDDDTVEKGSKHKAEMLESNTTDSSTSKTAKVSAKEPAGPAQSKAEVSSRDNSQVKAEVVPKSASKQIKGKVDLKDKKKSNPKPQAVPHKQEATKNNLGVAGKKKVSTQKDAQNSQGARETIETVAPSAFSEIPFDIDRKTKAPKYESNDQVVKNNAKSSLNPSSSKTSQLSRSAKAGSRSVFDMDDSDDDVGKIDKNTAKSGAVSSTRNSISVPQNAKNEFELSEGSDDDSSEDEKTLILKNGSNKKVQGASGKQSIKSNHQVSSSRQLPEKGKSDIYVIDDSGDLKCKKPETKKTAQNKTLTKSSTEAPSTKSNLENTSSNFMHDSTMLPQGPFPPVAIPKGAARKKAFSCLQKKTVAVLKNILTLYGLSFKIQKTGQKKSDLCELVLSSGFYDPLHDRFPDNEKNWPSAPQGKAKEEPSSVEYEKPLPTHVHKVDQSSNFETEANLSARESKATSSLAAASNSHKKTYRNDDKNDKSKAADKFSEIAAKKVLTDKVPAKFTAKTSSKLSRNEEADAYEFQESDDDYISDPTKRLDFSPSKTPAPKRVYSSKNESSLGEATTLKKARGTTAASVPEGATVAKSTKAARPAAVVTVSKKDVSNVESKVKHVLEPSACGLGSKSKLTFSYKTPHMPTPFSESDPASAPITAELASSSTNSLSSSKQSAPKNRTVAEPKRKTVSAAEWNCLPTKGKTAAVGKKCSPARDHDDSAYSDSDNESLDSPEAPNHKWPSYLSAASAGSNMDTQGGSDDDDDFEGNNYSNRHHSDTSQESLSEGGSSNLSDDEDDDNAPDQTLMFMIQSMAKLAESKENRQKCKLIAQTRSDDSATVKGGIQSWFKHVETDKIERVAQLRREMEEEQARLNALHDDLVEHGKAWAEAVAAHQEEIAARSDLFEKVKVKIAQVDENAGREDAGLRKRMRTKGKTAVEDFKLAKKRGVSKKDKGRKAAAQAMKMQFH